MERRPPPSGFPSFRGNGAGFTTPDFASPFLALPPETGGTAAVSTRGRSELPFFPLLLRRCGSLPKKAFFLRAGLLPHPVRHILQEKFSPSSSATSHPHRRKSSKQLSLVVRDWARVCVNLSVLFSYMDWARESFPRSFEFSARIYIALCGPKVAFFSYHKRPLQRKQRWERYCFSFQRVAGVGDTPP